MKTDFPEFFLPSFFMLFIYTNENAWENETAFELEIKLWISVQTH